MPPPSPCSLMGQRPPPPPMPVPPGRCPLPWVRPQTRFFYDADKNNCFPFTHPGCELNGPTNGFNQFMSYEECMNSCLARADSMADGSNGMMGVVGGGGEPSGWAMPSMTDPIPMPRPMPPMMLPTPEMPPPGPIISNKSPEPASPIGSSPFYCNDGSLIPSEMLCNGRPDCRFGEDETNCMFEPGPTQPTPKLEPNPFDHDPRVVMRLNSANFQSVIASNPRVIVQFYNPACKKCREFASEYAKASVEANRMGMGIVFAQEIFERCPVVPFIPVEADKHGIVVTAATAGRHWSVIA